MRVAFCGEPGSGKTALSELVGTRLSFARAVKGELAEELELITEIDRDQLIREMEDPAFKDQYRTLLQVWGTEYRRAQDPNYWVEKMEARISKIGSRVDLAVDDCRFGNEYTMLKRLGFKFIRLQSGPTTRHMVGEEAAHESEQYWPLFDFNLELPYLPLSYGADVVRMKFA